MNSTHFFFIFPGIGSSSNFGGLENLHVLFCRRQFLVPTKSCTPQSHRGSKDLKSHKVFSIFAWTSFSRI